MDEESWERCKVYGSDEVLREIEKHLDEYGKKVMMICKGSRKITKLIFIE